MDYHLSLSVSKFILLLEISRCKDKPAVMESLSETQGSILQYICEVSCQELLTSSLLPVSPAGVVWACSTPRGSHNRNLPQQDEPDHWVGDSSDRWADHCTKSLWRLSEETVQFCSDYFPSKCVQWDYHINSWNTCPQLVSCCILPLLNIFSIQSIFRHKRKAINTGSLTCLLTAGSLYKLHPTLATRLCHHTSQLTQSPFSYKLADDGSGRGAGLVAAIASRINAAPRE